MNKSEPVLRLLTPTGGHAAPFCQPGKGTLHHPTTSRERFLTWNGTLFFWFVSFSPMFDMLNIVLPTDDFMNIFKIVASVCTKMLFAVRSLGDDMYDQVL